MKYKRGDIVLTKEGRFLILGIRNQKEYIALKMRGNGHTKYRLPEDTISSLEQSNPDHAWIKLNDPSEPVPVFGNLSEVMATILTEMSPKDILIFNEESPGQWIVKVKGNESLWADGASLPEAIGNLIILHGESMKVELEIPKDL